MIWGRAGPSLLINLDPVKELWRALKWRCIREPKWKCRLQASLVFAVTKAEQMKTHNSNLHRCFWTQWGPRWRHQIWLPAHTGAGKPGVCTEHTHRPQFDKDRNREWVPKRTLLSRPFLCFQSSMGLAVYIQSTVPETTLQNQGAKLAIQNILAAFYWRESPWSHYI